MSSSPLLVAANNSEPFCRTQGSEASPPNTLSLGKRLFLTVEKDSLVITDEITNSIASRSCCGWVGAIGQSQKHTICLYNLLWAEVGETAITLQFAVPISKSSVKPTSLTYPFESSIRENVERWVSNLLAKAYEDSLPSKRLKVIINPFGGSGQAVNIFNKHAKALFEAAHCELDIEQTLHSQHAMKIAEELDIDKYDGVVCCSGDGVPHEVFNGLFKRKDAARALKKIAVCQLPGGSGNAMCWNLTGTGSASLATVAIIKGKRKPLDLVSITQGECRILSFLSQSLGMIAEVDLGTEHLRWMGDFRFTVGLLQRISKKTVYPCDIAIRVAIDDKASIRDHYRSRNDNEVSQSLHAEELPTLEFGTINDPIHDNWKLVHHADLGIFYAGNMAWMSAGANFFPAAKPNDGMFDLICISGTLNRIQASKTLLAVEDGSHFELPQVDYKKVLAYRIIPHKRAGVTEGYISIDGERIPFAPFQAEVHRGLATVLAKGDKYEATGV